MRNIKTSVPYKINEETYKIFLDISQLIISHDKVINCNAAPLSDIFGCL